MNRDMAEKIAKILKEKLQEWERNGRLASDSEKLSKAIRDLRKEMQPTQEHLNRKIGPISR